MNELTIPDASQMRGEIKAFMSERDILIARTAALRHLATQLATQWDSEFKPALEVVEKLIGEL